MNNILFSAILGYLTDLFGIGIGVLCALGLSILKRKYIKKEIPSESKKFLLSFVFEFSSGVMMAIVTFHLIPDALLKIGYVLTVAGIFFGFLIVHFIDRFSKKACNPSLGLGLCMLINLWLHNIPEGFILGTILSSDIMMAFILFFVIIIHNIPGGFIVALSYVRENIGKKTGYILYLLSGIPTAIGTTAGFLLGGNAPFLTGFITALAAGSMLYVLVFELSYEAKKLSKRRLTEIGYIVGLVAGILVV